MADPGPNVREPTPRPDESVVGAYFGQFTQMLDSEQDAREVAVALARGMGSKHFMSVLGIMSAMDRLYLEMRSVLNEFAGRNHFLVKVLTIEHLALAMKLYLISWHTMRDLLASLVSAAFDLGIADRDVSVRLVFNNGHVRSSGISDILEKFDRALPIKDLGKRRNDAVHRGQIPDVDVEEMLKERNTADAHRFGFLTSSPISDEEHKRRLSDLQERLRVLAESKKSLWEKVHAQTIALTAEVARELAVKAMDLYKRGAI